ncbi:MULTISPECIES: hypothetical protein [Kitasatospora]|uniref:Uncharacterized protein n=1 Tax=Kitasatospora cathayae TaxID=3004092 RepID=A0ABY7QF06_9ACTN|nr:hypothetical protein [Kitasatospora sp. HUAS 3-15]WBP91207.1 hypothetical protein O1G21_38575 [Kitasatospora sp. HUAS 3-15]
MAAGDMPVGRAWFGAAALASGAFPVVFAVATWVADWDANHPVSAAGDGSPGGGNMGVALAVPFFALAAVVCLVFPLLWGITVMRTRKGRSARELLTASAIVQGLTLLLALPVAASLPYGWAGVTALIAAELIALRIALQPLWSRHRAATA